MEWILGIQICAFLHLFKLETWIHDMYPMPKNKIKKKYRRKLKTKIVILHNDLYAMPKNKVKKVPQKNSTKILILHN